MNPPWTRKCPELEDLSLLEVMTSAKDGPPDVESGDPGYWKSCLWCMHVMAAIVPRDSWTGAALPMRLLDALARIRAVLQAGKPVVHHGPLTRIAAHCEPALAAILRRPRHRLLRQHKLLPFYRGREPDVVSMIWLARQPGRTLPEKLGARQRVLSPVRDPSVDVLENRVTRRVADELARLLARHLQPARSMGRGALSSDMEQTIFSCLEEVEQLCTIGIKDARLDVLPLREIREPNNALLSHPDYHRIWNAWRWLSSHRSDLRSLWRDGDHRMAVVSCLALAAFLMEKYGATLCDDLCLPGAGLGRDESFGLRGIRGAAFDRSQNLPLRLCVSHEGAEYLLTLQEKGGAITIARHLLGGDIRLLLPGKTRKLTLRLLAADREAPEGRLFPFVIESKLPHRPDARIEKEARYFDPEGLASFCAYVAGMIFESKPASAPEMPPRPATGEPSELIAPERVGLDLSSIIPRVIASSGQNPPAELHLNHWLAVRSLHLEKYGTHTMVARADRVFAMPEGDERWVSPTSLLTDSLSRNAARWEDHSGIDEAFRGIFRDLGQDASKTELAVAVSGLLDPPAQGRLRAAIGAEPRKVWFIERSIAAVLGWQSRGGAFGRANVQPGEKVFVVDAEAGALCISLLVARFDEAKGTLYWERDLSRKALPFYAALSYWSWLEMHLRELFQPTIEHKVLSEAQARELTVSLIQRADAERIFGQRETAAAKKEPAVLRLPHPSKGVLRLAPNAEARKVACDAWIAEYEHWLGTALLEVQKELRSDCTEHASSRRTHVLFVGRPFNVQSIRDRAGAVWERLLAGHEIACHTLPQAELLAGQGAHEFLRRFGEDVPSWEDILPNILVEVEGETGPESRYILTKKTVRPGDTVTFEVEKPFILPAHEKEYALPVVQEGQDGRVPYHALIRPPGFPLSRPLKVRLQVQYLYAEEEYRLLVVPESHGAPFQKMEVMWLDVENQPPEFAPRTAQDLKKTLLNLRTEIQDFDGKTPLPELAPFRDLVDNSIAKFRPPPPAPTKPDFRAEIRDADWANWLHVLTGWPKAKTKISKSHLISKPVNLCIALVKALDVLQVPFGDGYIQYLVNELKRNHEARTELKGRRISNLDDTLICKLLERGLKDPKSEAQIDAFLKLLTLLTRRSTDLLKPHDDQPPAKPARRDISWLNPPLGAIAMVLRSHEDLVLLLQDRPGVVRGIFKVVKQALDFIEVALTSRKLPEEAMREALRLDHDWAEPIRACSFTFRNAQELLMELLRLRGRSDTVPDVARQIDAGTASLHQLSQIIRRLDHSFRQIADTYKNATRQWLALAPARLRLEKPASGEMSHLSYALCACLAGNQPGRLVRIESD